jgi:hypothetical protein
VEDDSELTSSEEETVNELTEMRNQESVCEEEESDLDNDASM